MSGRILLLRLEAPLMSFGSVLVDKRGPTDRHPGTALITGLLANALGWDHSEGGRIMRLQDRIRLASRIDRPGTELIDYQTAKLDGKDRAWTTAGKPTERSGSPDTYDGAAQRWRAYWAGASVLAAVGLTGESGPGDQPGIEDMAQALCWPDRPLFIGRKNCLPSQPIFAGISETECLVGALRDGITSPVEARWPVEEGVPAGCRARQHVVHDMRNWVANVPAGSRIVCEGQLNPEISP